MLLTHWRDKQSEIEKIRYYEVFVRKSHEIAPYRDNFDAISNFEMKDAEDEFEKIDKEITDQRVKKMTEEARRLHLISDRLMDLSKKNLAKISCENELDIIEDMMDQEALEEEYGYHAPFQDDIDIRAIEQVIETGPSKAVMRMEDDVYYKLIRKLNI